MHRVMTTTKFMVALDRDVAAELLRTLPGNVLMFGPPGTGKTSLVVALARESGQETLWSTNCTPDMSSGLVVGHPHIIPVMDAAGKPIYWAKGPAIQAWEAGEVYLIDDLHKTSSDAEAELLTILNDPEWSHKILPDGSRVAPKDGASTGFRGIATMNGKPDELDDALRDRFPIIILVRKPSTEMMVALDEDVREICDSAYEACDSLNGGLPRFSYRECRAFCTIRRKLTDNATAKAGSTKLPLDKENIEKLSAELALGGDPVRADGFLRLVILAQAIDPDED